jgi:hypothetical protein
MRPRSAGTRRPPGSPGATGHPGDIDELQAGDVDAFRLQPCLDSSTVHRRGNQDHSRSSPQSLAEVVADAGGKLVVVVIELNDMPPRVCRWLRHPS